MVVTEFTTGQLAELVLIRHAPIVTRDRLCGREDVEADCTDLASFAALRRLIGSVDRLITSPALRCRQSAQALWPDATDMEAIPELWEQDFGEWEGRLYADMPDLGPLSPEDLAHHKPPQGESFHDVCERISPALVNLAKQGGRSAIVAHAGTVRAGLALALGRVAPALAFHIAPLSITRLQFLPQGGWAIACVNYTVE